MDRGLCQSYVWFVVGRKQQDPCCCWERVNRFEVLFGDKRQSCIRQFVTEQKESRYKFRNFTGVNLPKWHLRQRRNSETLICNIHTYKIWATSRPCFMLMRPLYFDATYHFARLLNLGTHFRSDAFGWLRFIALSPYFWRECHFLFTPFRSTLTFRWHSQGVKQGVGVIHSRGGNSCHLFLGCDVVLPYRLSLTFRIHLLLPCSGRLYSVATPKTKIRKRLPNRLLIHCGTQTSHRGRLLSVPFSAVLL